MHLRESNGKVAAQSGVVALGDLEHLAVWSCDECLIVRFVGFFNKDEVRLLHEYQRRTTPVRLQLPGEETGKVVVVGFEDGSRTFFLARQPVQERLNQLA